MKNIGRNQTGQGTDDRFRLDWKMWSQGIAETARKSLQARTVRVAADPNAQIRSEVFRLIQKVLPLATAETARSSVMYQSDVVVCSHSGYRKNEGPVSGKSVAPSHSRNRKIE